MLALAQELTSLAGRASVSLVSSPLTTCEVLASPLLATSKAEAVPKSDFSAYPVRSILATPFSSTTDVSLTLTSVTSPLPLGIA